MTKQVAIVTGGGIGAAVARAFISQGTSVAIADLDIGTARALAKELSADGGSAVAVEVNVLSEESISSAVSEAIAHFGRVDFLVYTCGIIINAPALELSAADWSRTLDTHLTGAFLFSKEVARHMIQESGGRIVYMSSVAAQAPVPGRGAYSPAKAGLVSLAGVLSLEWAAYGINVNAVCPGVVATPATEAIYRRDPDLRTSRLKRMPSGREVKPEEVGDLVLFLCSDRAAHISGAAIPIDGSFLNNQFLV